ncbi:MAG: type II secretion system F family protein, partial [Verrucomicrobiota bacterium]
MPTFQYTAVNAQRQNKTGTVEAANATEASSQIKAMGLFPTKINELVADAPAATGKKVKKGASIKSKSLSVFTRQLSTLIGAGLPLLRSLTTLQKQEKNVVLKNTMAGLATAVEGGGTFSEALNQYPGIFNKLYVNMVKAGELGGVLEIVLARLAEFQEKSEKIKGKVISAMFYPVVVLFIAIAILTFLLVFIVPKFQQIFTEMLGGKPLPPLTQFVIDASNFLKNHYIIVIGIIGALVVGFNLFKSTKAGQATIDRFKFNAPVFGGLIQKTAIARFTRTLGTLVSSGVPILQALQITKETAGNSMVSAAIEKVHDSVREGENIVTPLEASGIFPPMVISMVQVGEETGKLPDMLIKVADVYEEEVDNSVAGLTSLLEPIMIVFLALIVGVIVVALFLP